MRAHALRLSAVAFALAATLSAQAPQEQDPAELRQERASAEKDAPQLVEVLGIKPGATIADIGSGGGAMSVVLGHWNTGGRVYATDVTAHALRWTRQYVKNEGLTNVTVLEGAAAATNLPDACCDAAFLRNVYHHVTEPAAFNKSLLAAVKPGGRLAIIDFEDRRGGRVPAGVPANRGGHGIPPAIVIEELTAAGFTHVRTIDAWPPAGTSPSGFLVLFQR
jgi:ubiquinone/menaquinone biosynthesis C-methylase UbiE